LKITIVATEGAFLMFLSFGVEKLLARLGNDHTTLDFGTQLEAFD